MENEIDTQVAQVAGEIPQVDFPDIGLGTCRSSGTMIALLLALEEPFSRAEILVHIAKKFGITLAELAGEYNDSMCPKCGCSLAAHRHNDGNCF